MSKIFEFRQGAHRCTCEVSGDGPHAVVTVTIPKIGSKVTQLGNDVPLMTLARTLAGEILRGATPKML